MWSTHICFLGSIHPGKYSADARFWDLIGHYGVAPWDTELDLFLSGIQSWTSSSLVLQNLRWDVNKITK